MWASFKEYLPLCLKGWWGIVVSGICAALGVMIDALPNFDVPWWGWLIVAVLGIAGAQFQAFHKVRCERERYRPQKPPPDSFIRDAINYLCEESQWGLWDILAGSGIGGAMIMIPQKAFQGKIIIYGMEEINRYGPDKWSKLEKDIKPKYWEDMQLSPYCTIENLQREEETEPMVVSNIRTDGIPKYTRLRINMEQITHLWAAASTFERLVKANVGIAHG